MSLLRCFYYFVQNDDFNVFELFFKLESYEFVQFSKCFSEFGIKVVLYAIICPLFRLNLYLFWNYLAINAHLLPS